MPEDFFAHLKATYEPLLLPYRGDPARHAREEVLANQQYMQTHLDEREHLIRTLLMQHDVRWPETLSGLDAEPLVAQTRQWAKTCWPALREPVSTLDMRRHWLHGERSGDFIGLSVVSDTALLLGQYIVANRPGLAWGMDTDQASKDDGMATVNRWVLRGRWLPDPDTTVAIDVEQVVLGLFLDPEDSSERLFDTWNQLVRGCLDGGYEGSALVKA